jgi:cyclopropane fatty-acyl-phospholipid synthase-like methyltransferase
MNSYPKEIAKDYWNEKAKEDALFWTWSNKVSEDEYFKSGVNWVENWMKKYFPEQRDTCLEIGCGCGRLALPMASYFKNIIGIDISDKMIEIADKYKTIKQVKNIGYYRCDNLDDVKMQFDFIYSVTAFQHMEYKDWMEYIEKGFGKLNSGGIFYVHAYFNGKDDDIKNSFKKIGFDIINSGNEGECRIVILKKPL